MPRAKPFARKVTPEGVEWLRRFVERTYTKEGRYGYYLRAVKAAKDAPNRDKLFGGASDEALKWWLQRFAKDHEANLVSNGTPAPSNAPPAEPAPSNAPPAEPAPKQAAASDDRRHALALYEVIEGQLRYLVIERRVTFMATLSQLINDEVKAAMEGR